MKVGWKVNFFPFSPLVEYFLKVNTSRIYGQGRLVRLWLCMCDRIAADKWCHCYFCGGKLREDKRKMKENHSKETLTGKRRWRSSG